MIPVAYAEETTNNILNDIEKMSETIIKYGPSVVVLAIFFVAFSIMTLVIIKQNLKMKNHMMKSEDNNGKELKDIMNKLLDAVINKTGSNKEELISEFEGSKAYELDASNDDAVKTLFEELHTEYGQIDGNHHKTWVIDQIIRELLGTEYDNFIKEYEEDGEYTWDIGIAP